jgi:hypothetical protein
VLIIETLKAPFKWRGGQEDKTAPRDRRKRNAEASSPLINLCYALQNDLLKRETIFITTFSHSPFSSTEERSHVKLKCHFKRWPHHTSFVTSRKIISRLNLISSRNLERKEKEAK